MPWVALAGAVLGGAAGGQKDKKGGYQQGIQQNNIELQDFDSLNQGRSGLEADAYNSQVSGFQDLLKLIQGGPGQNEIDANTNFQNSFASELQALFTQATKPTAQGIQRNYQDAQSLFAPQQVQLDQQFQDQETASNRLAARMGRAGNDPTMRNKLMQEKTRQQTQLNAQIGSAAQQLPGQRAQQAMDLGGALSNLRGGLATQALQNRQTLMSMGNQLAQSERNYRLSAANRNTNSYSNGEDWSGGGFKGMMTGAMSGASAFMGMGGMGGGAAGGGVGGGGGMRAFSSPV